MAQFYVLHVFFRKELLQDKTISIVRKNFCKRSARLLLYSAVGSPHSNDKETNVKIHRKKHKQQTNFEFYSYHKNHRYKC